MRAPAGYTPRDRPPPVRRTVNAAVVSPGVPVLRQLPDRITQQRPAHVGYGALAALTGRPRYFR